MKRLLTAALLLAVSTGLARSQASYDGFTPRYQTPQSDYFNEPNYRPPGKEPNRYEFMIGVDIDRDRESTEPPRPWPPRPRPPHHGHDRPHSPHR